MKLTLQLNGRARTVRCDAMTPALELLRGTLGQPGLPEPCAHGGCGGCAVLLEGAAVNACRVPALRLRHAELRTARGLGAWGEQAAQVLERHGAGACGGCRGAILVVLRELSMREEPPDETTLREALSGTSCGCGAYTAMLEAAREVLGVDRRR